MPEDQLNVHTPNEGFRFLAAAVLATAALVACYGGGVPSPRVGEVSTATPFDDKGQGIQKLLPRQQMHNFARGIRR